MESMVRLGDYIEPVTRRNTELKYGVDDVMGMTNTKELMPTKARSEYADLSKFYILEPGEFIYNPRTSRNGEKVGMAYNDTDHNILFTFNNTPFRVKGSKRNELDSDYLYLFFLNPEFDRYARYNSWGSATELFTWDEMCNTLIDLPKIEEQKKIVRQYRIIVERINLLEKINQELLNQANCIFKENILNSADDMETEPLDKNIEFINGIAMQKFRPGINEAKYPVIKIRELSQGYCDENSEYCRIDIDKSHIINNGDIVFSWSGSLKIDFWSDGTAGLNQHLFKVVSDKYYNWFIYLWVNYYLLDFQTTAQNKGTTFGHIKREDLTASTIKIPSIVQMEELNRQIAPLFDLLQQYKVELQVLRRIKKIVLP